MRSLRISALFFLVCGLTLAADLQSLISTADVVIIGTASPDGSASGNTLLLTVTPERVLKGVASPGVALNAQWASHPGAVGNATQTSTSFKLPAAYRGIWFFKRSTAGILNPIPVRLGEQASVLDLFYQLSSAPMPQALSGLAGGSSIITDQLAVELANAASRETDDDLPGNFVFATWSLDSPVIRQAFRVLADSPQSRAKATGLAGLVARGDVDGLLALEQQAGALRISDLQLPVWQLLTSFRNPDSAAIACLGRLALGMGGYRDALGDAAMHALGAMHTKDALAALAAGLDSPRQERRRWAVNGLAAFANGMPMQTPATMATLAHMRGALDAPFRSSETMAHITIPADAGADADAEIVGFWKNWWRDNSAKLGL